MTPRALLPLALAALALSASPARARGYEEHLTHRPRLAFDGRDRAHVERTRDRLLARAQPWADAYARLRDLAETGRTVPHGAHPWRSQPDPYVALYGQEVHNGLVARAKAVVVWLATEGVDPAWRPLPRLPGQATPRGWLEQQAREAVAVLDGAYDRWTGWRGWDSLRRGIVSSESLLVHMQAWDLLAALPAGWGLDLGPSRERLARLAEDHRFWGIALRPMQNNHGLRVDAAVGAAGVCFNRHDRYRWWKPGTWWANPRGWVERGLDTCDPDRRGSTLRRQVEAGSYAEGTSYHAYAEEMYAPFFWAYARFDGARPLWQSARLDRVTRWSVALRLPDGQRPPVDNARVATLATGWWTNRLPRGSRDAAQRRLFGGDWADQGHPGLFGARGLELLAAWDPRDDDAQALAAWAAPGESAFLPEEGAAVLRAGGGRDAAWAMLQAEHGPAREAGRGHESVDPLHFLVAAERDLIALAPGYAGWTTVERTRKAEHHNVLLVDGEGPKPPRNLVGWAARGADAFLEARSPRTSHGARLQSAAGRTAYRGAALRRTLALVGDRVAVIEDRVEDEPSMWPFRRRVARDWTAQVHLNGGGDRRGPAALAPLGATFATHLRGVPVEVAVDSTRGRPRLALERSFDAIGGGYGGGASEHAVLRATARGERANLLTVLCWGVPGQAPAAPVRLLDRPGACALAVTWSDLTVLALTQEAPGRLAVPATATTPALETDATLAIVAWRAGAPWAVVAHDATTLRAGALSLTRAQRGTLSQ